MARERSISDPMAPSELGAPPTSATKPKAAPAIEGAATYKVLATSYIGGEIRYPGALVQFAGRPGDNLEYVSGPEWKEPGPAAAKPV